MSKQRFLGLMAVVWTLLAQGCAGTTAAGVTVTAGTNQPPSPPSAAGVPKPQVEFSASAAVVVCGDSAISGGINYPELLDTVRRMDAEVAKPAAAEKGAKPPAAEAGAKPPATEEGAKPPANPAWHARLKKIADATIVEQCSKEAREVAGVLGTRYTFARTLCDLRRGDSGGAEFKEHTGTRINTVIVALRNAARKPKLAECQKAAADVHDDLLEVVAEANAQCSPPEAESEVSCAQTLVKFCRDGQGAEAAAACMDKTPPAKRAINARSPSGPDAQARGVGAGAGLQSAILTGAADFFVERAEQEMSLFAVEVVGRELCADSSPVKVYLPKTCGLIGSPQDGETADTLGATPGAIRAAAKADLEALPASLIVKIHGKDPNLGCAAAFGWAVADEVGHGSDLATLLKEPKALLERKLVKDSCAGGGAQQDIENLAKHLKQLLSGAPELVASQLRSGNFERMVSTNRDLTTAATGNANIGAGLTQPGTILAEVLRRLVELDRAISAYHADPTPARRVVMVVAAIQTVEPILAHLARQAAYKEDIRTAVDLFSQILNHQYTEAIITASSFQVAKQLLPRNARNLLSLTAGLAQADSSDDVKKTLQDAALPLGSWRRKNVPRFGITLTGMVGGYLGHEFVTESPQENIDVSNGTSLAPSLLVGPDLHWGLAGSRLGLQFTVLDLGALATIRLDDPKSTNETADGYAGPVDANPDVRIEQVFAPGLFAYFGIGPFAFGPMATFVPSLRPYQEANGDINPLTVFRVGGVVAVDVSVLPLL